ncbi:MAG: bifunctional methylenetetrahydrofolate dehydrogenase/methenyltetrahydrofolate cyclohydrolase FolD [Pseudomonadota bacterium]
MAKIMDGKATAAAVTADVKAETASFIERTGVQPGLAVVIVGEHPASMVYVANKEKKAVECGFQSFRHNLPADVDEKDLLDLVAQLNEDTSVHGILVQLPLPPQISETAVIQAIAREKDVDGFHFENVGRIAVGQSDDAFVPCTPAGCMKLIENARGKDLSGLDAVVVGRSNIVGKPMASLLLAANATVTIAHSRTNDLPGLCRTADILVAAVGRPEMIKGNWVKEGATVIDVGINRVDAPERGQGKTKLVGDVDFTAAQAFATHITPVPGGVGPMTIAMLMANTLKSAKNFAGSK